MNSPFLRPDARPYPEILTDAAMHVLAGNGIDRFSVRAMARWMNVTPATLLGEYSRARILEMVIISFERRWLSWSGSVRMYGPAPSRIPLRLPATPDERLGVRVLSAVQHLADAERLRGNSAPAAHLDRLRREELALLKYRMTPVCCSSPPEDAVALAVMAFISGLRLSLSEGDAVGPTVDDAIDLLGRYVGPAVQHVEGCAEAQIAS
jgi:hypothetical protein